MTTLYDHPEDRGARGLDVRLWREMLVHARPYRRPLGGLALAGLAMAATDTMLPLVTAWIIDDAVSAAPPWTLAVHAALYAVLVACIALLVWSFIVLAGRAATGIAYDVRRRAFAHLQKLSFSFYDRRPVGWLMARLTSDCARLSSVVPWCLLDLTWGSAFILGIAVMLLCLRPGLGLVVLGVVPALALASVLFQRRLLETQRLVRMTNSRITARFNESIMGLRTTKALVREERNLGEFRTLSGAMYEHSVRNMLLAALYLPLVLTIGSIGVGLALWRGGAAVQDGMSLGTLVAFMQYAGLLYMPVQEMADRFTQFQAAQASAERLHQLLGTEPEIRDAPGIADARAGADGGPGRDEERIRSVEFDRVSFAYEEGEPVLEDFRLRVEAGQTVALVGETGSGKTTVVSLLCRFYEPTGGTLRINGRDYRERSLEWLQSRLGIVLQTPHLFSGTVAENIRYGRLDAAAEEIEAAARLVHAHEFILSLEAGYETEVGEGGGRLSIGQKQLVALARAVLADPQIFVMDEATSSVDTETERRIQAGIGEILRGRIGFLIAHRLSTVRSATRILVMQAGRVLEEGDHESLMRCHGAYHRLVTGAAAASGEGLLPRPAPGTLGGRG